MLIIVLFFLWLIFSPFRVNAQDYTPTPTETGVPTQADTLTPTTTIAPTPTPTSTPSSTTAPTSAPAASASTTPTDTPIPTPKPTSKQSSTNGRGGFGGGGLVDEKETVDNGLGFGDGQTLGAATQDIDSTGDKDLLGTLIFLTGAVVLLVWTVYIILIQKGIIKSEPTKDEKIKDFTPLTPK